MKKILSTAFILGALITTANAVEVKHYIGVDGSYNRVRPEGYHITDKQHNIGVNYGAKIKLNKTFYTGLEGYINSGILIDKKYDDGNGKSEMTNYYGLRGEFGVIPLEKFSLFTKFGLNRVSYENNWSEGFDSSYFEDDDFIISYGLGASYMLTNSLETKFTFEQMNTRYNDEGDVAKFIVKTYRISLSYLF